jgi:uncharacterized protein (DUF3084 family)
MATTPYLELKARVEKEQVLVELTTQQARHAQEELRRLRSTPIPTSLPPRGVANLQELVTEHARLVAEGAEWQAQTDALVNEQDQLCAQMQWLDLATKTLRHELEVLGDVRERNPDLRWDT